ncbi:MAG TPA: hypothetical protein VFL86_05295, partial [Burkholderiaceae bacterium]|nr:hypothetical protein [Burkholderiaceae bacterium]
TQAGGGADQAAPRTKAEDGAEAAAPDPAASQPRIHAWRRLLLAALAPATAAPQPPALDPLCWAGLLRHDAAWLRATLQRLGRSAAVRRRIAQGLDAGLLRDLIGLWVTPARRDFMATTVHGLDGLARRQPALRGLAAAGLWEHTLAWLWLERKTEPDEAARDERAFVQSVLRHLERRGDVAPAAWQVLLGPAADLEAAVHWVLAQVGRWAQAELSAQREGSVAHAGDALPKSVAAPGTGPAGQASAQADALEPPSDHIAAATPPKAATPAEAPATARTLRAWRRMLRTMLAPQRHCEAQAPWEAACWEGLLRHDAPWLRTKVQRLGRFASVRRAMARGLSPALLRDLTGLWVGPDRQDFIVAFVQGLGRLAAAKPGLTHLAGPDLWAQALGLLWVDQEGTQAGAGGERAFVRGMLRHLERHEGVEPAAWAAGEAEVGEAWVQRQVREALADEQPGAVVGEVDDLVPMPRRQQLVAAVSAGRFEAEFETLWFDASRDDALWLRAWLCREDVGGIELGEAGDLGQAQAARALRQAQVLRQAQDARALRQVQVLRQAQDARALRQAQGERGWENQPIAQPPVRAELVEALVPGEPALRQAQGERTAESESESATANNAAPTSAPDHATPYSPQPTPRLAPLAALRRALAQRLPQPRWQPSLSPWLTPSECIKLATTVRRLAQSTIPQEPQPHDLEPWLWDRTLARLWRLPPQRLDLHALAQQLAQDLAQRSTPSPAAAGEGRGEGNGLGRAPEWPTANGHAPHPDPLPQRRERAPAGPSLPPKQDSESADSPFPPTRENESVAAPLLPTQESQHA